MRLDDISNARLAAQRNYINPPYVLFIKDEDWAWTDKPDTLGHDILIPCSELDASKAPFGKNWLIGQVFGDVWIYDIRAYNHILSIEKENA